MTAEASVDLTLPAQTEDGRARTVALRAIAGDQVRPTGLIEFRSSGRVLVVGSDEAARETASHLTGQLDVSVLIAVSEPADVGFQETGGLVRLVGKPAELTGHLGQFCLTFETAGGLV